MLSTVWAVIREGKVELIELVDLPEGTKALITFLPDEDAEFWSSTSQVSLDAVWNNRDDDVYAELLKE